MATLYKRNEAQQRIAHALELLRIDGTPISERVCIELERGLDCLSVPATNSRVLVNDIVSRWPNGDVWRELSQRLKSLLEASDAADIKTSQLRRVCEQKVFETKFLDFLSRVFERTSELNGRIASTAIGRRAGYAGFEKVGGDRSIYLRLLEKLDIVTLVQGPQPSYGGRANTNVFFELTKFGVALATEQSAVKR